MYGDDMDIYLDEERFYHKIKKYINKDVRVHFNYNDLDIVDDSFLKDSYDDNLKFKIYMIHAINLKDLRMRYSYIYDVVCEYLDKSFEKNNWCDFQNNRCVAVRNKTHCSESLCGCCYGSKRGICKNLDKNHCKIKSLSCKLFSCRYLKKRKKNIKINDIVLLKYFFNTKQKFIIEYSIFKDKDEMIDLLLKYKSKFIRL